MLEDIERERVLAASLLLIAGILFLLAALSGWDRRTACAAACSSTGSRTWRRSTSCRLAEVARLARGRRAARRDPPERRACTGCVDRGAAVAGHGHGLVLPLGRRPGPGRPRRLLRARGGVRGVPAGAQRSGYRSSSLGPTGAPAKPATRWASGAAPQPVPGLRRRADGMHSDCGGVTFDAWTYPGPSLWLFVGVGFSLLSGWLGYAIG